MHSFGRTRSLFQCLLTAEQTWCPAVGITWALIHLSREMGTLGLGAEGHRDCQHPQHLLDLQGAPSLHFQSDLTNECILENLIFGGEEKSGLRDAPRGGAAPRISASLCLPWLVPPSHILYFYPSHA